MTQQNNRVLARKGARSLSEEEITQVGGFGTPVLFTFYPPDCFDQVQA